MATGTGAAIGAGEEKRHRRAGYPGIHVLLCCETKDVDGRDVVREGGGARLVPGHDKRCESLQCAIDCWLKSPRRLFAAKKLKIKKHFDFRCLRAYG
jgi:hypothetical protein